MNLRCFFVSIALACPVPVSAMGLLPRDKDEAAWESLQGQVLKALGGSCKPVTRPVGRVTAAARTGITSDELPVNTVVTAKLHAMDKVELALGPEKKQGKPQDAGGMLTLTLPVTGTYVINSVGHAWVDVVDRGQSRFAKARHYLWVDFCGRRMKVGIFDLRMGARYWIQISASPEIALDLFVAGPLD